MPGLFDSLIKSPAHMRGTFLTGAIRVTRKIPPEKSLKKSLQKAPDGQEPLGVFFVKKIATFLRVVVQRQDLPAKRRENIKVVQRKNQNGHSLYFEAIPNFV